MRRFGIEEHVVFKKWDDVDLAKFRMFLDKYLLNIEYRNDAIILTKPKTPKELAQIAWDKEYALRQKEENNLKEVFISGFILGANQHKENGE